MTKTERNLLMAVVFLAGCEASQVARVALAVPEARAGVPAQRYEYWCERANDNITDMANKLGQQGWELSAAASPGAGGGPLSGTAIVWCFQRPLP